MKPLRDYIKNRHVAGHFTVNLILTNIVMGISVFSLGFDNVLFSTVQAMDPFIRQFGTYNAQTDTYAISSTNLAFLNSFPLVVYAIGLLLAMVVGERYGRRIVLILMQVLCFVGITVTFTSTTYGQILAGRCLVQAYIGMQEWLIPMLRAELVPAKIRGGVVTMFVFEHQFAEFICSLITNFTSNNSDNSSWRIPVLLMYIFPSLVLLLQWVVPESPRWLLRQGRFDDAVYSLHFMFGCSSDYSAAEEAQLLKEGLDEADNMSKGNWIDLFRGVNRRRTLIVIMAAAMSMLSGNAFTSAYGTIFLSQIGGINAFTGTMIKKAVVVCGPITAILLIEHLGRRGLYMIWGTAASAALLVMGGLGCVKSQTRSIKQGIVAMSIFFPYARIVSFGVMATLLAAEIPTARLRDKTSFIAWTVQNLLNFVTSFTLPYLLNAPYANLSSKVGFIYGSFALCGVVWAFFFLPELRGRSLEEIDEMFEQKVPARMTRGWTTSNVNSVGARVTQLENETAGTMDKGVRNAKLAGDDV